MRESLEATPAFAIFLQQQLTIKEIYEKPPKKHDGRATVSNSGAVRTSAVVALFIGDGRDVDS